MPSCNRSCRGAQRLYQVAVVLAFINLRCRAYLMSKRTGLKLLQRFSTKVYLTDHMQPANAYALSDSGCITTRIVSGDE